MADQATVKLDVIEEDERGRSLSFSHIQKRRSRLGLIVSSIFTALLILGTAITMGVGWHFKLAENDIPTSYKGTWQYFTDDSCTLATTTVMGPCWKGEGAGYEGYFWSFSCDIEFFIYEHMCDVTNCTNCQDGNTYLEVANECITNGEDNYRWVCII